MEQQTVLPGQHCSINDNEYITHPKHCQLTFYPQRVIQNT